MIIFPAIDLKDGNCVRLVQGRMDDETIFNLNPSEQAKKFEEAGFKWIHVVDLNGAIEGRPKNIYSVQKIIKSVKVPIQLGGGVRDIKTAEAWIEAGVSRIIVGTIAVKKPKIVQEMCKLFPGKIAVGLDANEGKVAINGWIKKTKTPAVDVAKKFEDAGISAIIYTDISRDGLLEGANVEETVKLAEAVRIPIIASGGVTNLADVQAYKNSGKISGVVIGRALYDNKFTPAEVLGI